MLLTITSWAMSQSWAFVFKPHDVLPYFFGGKVVRLVFQLSGCLEKKHKKSPKLLVHHIFDGQFEAEVYGTFVFFDLICLFDSFDL